MTTEAALAQLAETVKQHRALPAPAECRRLRLACGATIADVARAVGVTPTAVIFWEQGRRRPRGENRDRYLEALQVMREAALR